MISRKKCGIVVAHEPGWTLEGVADVLRQHGVAVDFLRPPLSNVFLGYQLLVLRAKTREVTAWAKEQRGCGTVVVSDPEIIDRVKDRQTCREWLRRRGVTLARAFSGTAEELCSADLNGMFPIVLKQRFVHSVPVGLACSKGNLRRLLENYNDRTEFIAEQYIDGRHFTVFFIGDHVTMFEKGKLCKGVLSQERPLAVPPSVSHLVHTYKETFRIHFGKIDVVVPPLGHAVFVDGGISPNLPLVSNAQSLLADYLLPFCSNTES
jgi:hypothetical protein